MRYNPELGCYEATVMPHTQEEIDMRREELTHTDGCYNCANSKYCWEATRLGFACEDWERSEDE
jgi:hypothetical protein